MKSVLFIFDFPYIHKQLEKINEFNKVLIHQEGIPYNPSIYNHVFLVKDLADFHEVEKVVDEFLSNGGQIEAICTSYELAVETVGFLRDRYQISGINEKASGYVRDKIKMKEKASELGIKCASAKVLSNEEDIRRFIKQYHYPVVIKPIDGAGTLNTFKISNEEELSGFLVYGRNKLTESNHKFIIEEFMEGEEYHVDSVVQGGKVKFASVGKYLFNCIDTVGTNKAVASVVIPAKEYEVNEILNQILKLNNTIITGFGIDNSICHLECFVKGENIAFGEIAARIGGGVLIGSCILNTHGVDIFEEFVNVEVYRKTELLKRERDVYTGVVTFTTDEGIVKDISAESDFAGMEGLIEIKILAKKGSVVNKKNSTAQRTGYAIIEGKSLEEVQGRLLDAESKFFIEIENK